jgi:hypothetical protein
MEVKGLTPKELSDLILSVGTGRGNRRLSPVEVAHYCKKARIGKEELTKELLLSQDQLRFFEDLLELPVEYQPLVDWGKTSHDSLGFTSAAIIAARIKDPKEQGVLIRAAMEYQLSKSDVIHIAQMHHKPGNSMEESIKKVIELRPIEEKVFIVMGAIQSNELQQKLIGLTQYQRNSILEKTVRGLLNFNENFGARLGIQNFSLILSEDQNKILSTFGNVEEKISNSLLKII